MLNLQNIAALTAVDHTLYSAGEQAFLTEYGPAKGQGGGWFELRESGDSADEVLVFEPDTSPGNWRWHRIYDRLNFYDAGGSVDALRGGGASITAASSTLTISTGGLTSALIGKTVVVRGAFVNTVGTGDNRPLITTISAVPSATTLTLADAAGQTVTDAHWVIGDATYDDLAWARLLALQESFDLPAGVITYTQSPQYQGWRSDIAGEQGYTRDVENITLTSGQPVLITITEHGVDAFRNNDVSFSGVGGTTELNGNTYDVTWVNADNFTLDGTDGDDFSAFTSGGTADLEDVRHTGIDDITFPSGSPVIINIDDHGVETGQTVVLRKINGAVELNDIEYRVTVIDGDNFTLDGTDGDDYTTPWLGRGSVNVLLPGITIRGAGRSQTFLEPLAYSIQGLLIATPDCLVEDIHLGPSYGAAGQEMNSLYVNGIADRFIGRRLTADYTHNAGFRLGSGGFPTDTDGFVGYKVTLEDCVSSNNFAGSNLEMVLPRYVRLVRCDLFGQDVNSYTAGRGLARLTAQSDVHMDECHFYNPRVSTGASMVTISGDSGSRMESIGGMPQSMIFKNCRFDARGTASTCFSGVQVRELVFENTELFVDPSTPAVGGLFHAGTGFTMRGGKVSGGLIGMSFNPSSGEIGRLLFDGVLFEGQSTACLELSPNASAITIQNCHFDAPSVANVAVIDDQAGLFRPQVRIGGNTYADSGTANAGWAIFGGSPVIDPVVDGIRVSGTVFVADDDFASIFTPQSIASSNQAGRLFVRKAGRSGVWFEAEYSAFATNEVTEIGSNDASGITWAAPVAGTTPTGATGADGFVGVYVTSNGFIHLENRSGAGANLSFELVA